MRIKATIVLMLLIVITFIICFQLSNASLTLNDLPPGYSIMASNQHHKYAISHETFAHGMSANVFDSIGDAIRFAIYWNENVSDRTNQYKFPSNFYKWNKYKENE